MRTSARSRVAPEARTATICPREHLPRRRRSMSPRSPCRERVGIDAIAAQDPRDGELGHGDPGARRSMTRRRAAPDRAARTP